MIQSNIRANPFYQSAKQWQIHILGVHAEHIPAFEEAFGSLALAIASFETDEAGQQWQVDILTDASPIRTDIAARLALVSGLFSIPLPAFEIKPLQSQDWVGHVETSFPALHVGRFYVYGSHIKTPSPQGTIALKITAGAAFGSGEHATTSGCLKALSILARRRCFKRPLDMGCGSGILAIAMAKLWRAETLGVDIDPVSVRVARENAAINRTHTLTHFVAGDGYLASEVRAQAPFDCIVANILARPLMRMAPLLARNLSTDGVAILSGLLASQERMVLAAHRTQGLRLHARIMQAGWNTLIISRH